MPTTTITERTVTIAELHELRSVPTPRAVGRTGACDPCVVLPQRFDVHRVADVLGELERELRSSEHVTIDGSAVEMIDLVALEGTERLIAQHPNVVIQQPSVALRVTTEFTGSDLTSSFVGHHLVEAA